MPLSVRNTGIEPGADFTLNPPDSGRTVGAQAHALWKLSRFLQTCDVLR